jgi:aryl-alcohol dehydrogenase (NADP+)
VRHVRFGRTGLRVSQLCLGTMTFGVQCDEAASRAILDRAAAAGITFLDTADVYPLGGTAETVGRTERILGDWLRGRRQNFIVATKGYGATGPNPWDQGLSRKHLLDAIDASLTRLGTDYVDLYQIHHPDPHTPMDETLGALDAIVTSGKARHVGCSNLPAWETARALGRSDVLRLARFTSVQPRYNLLFRQIERDLLPLCAAEGLAVIPYNPLAGGFLSGKHQPGAPTEGGRFTLGTAAERYQERYWHDRMFKTVDELRPVAEASGVSMATMAMQWVLANPVITSPIVGASRPAQLADSVAAVGTPIDPAVKATLDEMTHEFRFGDNAR